MKRESIRLVCLGALLGVLTLSAALFAGPGGGGGETRAAGTAVPAESVDAPALTEEVAEVFAPQALCSPALRVESDGPVRRLWLCDLHGNPYMEIDVDGARQAVLGPIPPGRYAVTAGTEALGTFQLAGDAALTETTGRLWTDGTVLHLEDFCPGEAEIRVCLSAPGYYSFRLVDDTGLGRSGDLFIPSDEQPEDGLWRRTLYFRGLPEGRYTLVRNREPLLQFQVLAGGTARVELAEPVSVHDNGVHSGP